VESHQLSEIKYINGPKFRPHLVPTLLLCDIFAIIASINKLK